MARQAGDHLSGSEDFKRAVREYEQIAQGVNDTLPLEGLSLLKAYVEADLRFLVRLKDKASTQEGHYSLFLDLRVGGGDGRLKGDRGSAGGGLCLDASKDDLRSRWDQDFMLVSDVELMEAVEPFAIPTRKRLYRVKDNISYPVAGAMTRSYRSIDGSPHRLPITPEGKLGVAIDGVTVGFNEQAVCVVERCSEIMDRISDHCWRMAGKVSAEGEAPIIICAGDEGLSVFTYERLENRFQLVDVMFGPFGL